MDKTEPPLLDYDTVRQAKPMAALHYIALTCGLLPLVVGVSAFVLFLITRHRDIPVIGFLTLFGGTFLAILGGICALIYGLQARRADPHDRQVALRRVKWDAAMILANFPVAVVLTFAGVWAVSLITVVISNDGTRPVDSVVLQTDQGDYAVGMIQPGASRSIHTFRTRIKVNSSDIVRNQMGEHHSLPVPVVAHGDLADSTLHVDVMDDSVEIYSYED